MQWSSRWRIRSAAAVISIGFYAIRYHRGVVARPTSLYFDRIVRVRTADVSRLLQVLQTAAAAAGTVHGQSRDDVPPDAPADERRERFGVSHQRTFADTPIGHSH